MQSAFFLLDFIPNNFFAKQDSITQCHQFKRKMLFIKRLLVRPLDKGGECDNSDARFDETCSLKLMTLQHIAS
jgi:hypothetical protein